MEHEYHFETFGDDTSAFDTGFTDFLNRKRTEGWKVKNCYMCHGGEGGKTYASCIFKRHR